MSPNSREKPRWSPNTDVFISKTGGLIIKVDLGGIRSEDLQITVEGRRLKIVGVRRDSELDDAKVLLVDGSPEVHLKVSWKFQTDTIYLPPEPPI